VKYGKNESWHDWIKVHLVCGVKTHVVTGLEITRATQDQAQAASSEMGVFNFASAKVSVT